MAILSIGNKITTSHEEFERYKSSDSSKVLSDAKAVEDFSIELSIGSQWADDLSGDRAHLYKIESDSVAIKPGKSIVVEVEESIRLPFNMYGIVLQTGSIFLEQGLIVGSGKIEPSYSGNLLLLIYNTSSTTRRLKKGKKIASAIFMRTDRTLVSSPIQPSREIVQKTLSKPKKLVRFLQRDWRFLITVIVSVLSSSVAAVLVQLLVEK